jgi:hypothetical protein
MDEVARLKRVVLSLPDITLRVGWLREHLTTLTDAEAAKLLEGLCEESERSDPAAREVVLIVALLLASNGDSPWIDRLRTCAEERHLLSIGRMLRRAPPPTIHDRPASELPVPDYGKGRELTVGERRALARTPNRRAFDKLLGDPHPLVIQNLLQNPRLTEDDVVRMVTRRPARLEVLTAIAIHVRWLSRARVRMSLLLNPGAPSTITMPLVAVCTRSELIEVVQGVDAHVLLRATAQELLVRRPPLRAADANALLQ